MLFFMFMSIRPFVCVCIQRYTLPKCKSSVRDCDHKQHYITANGPPLLILWKSVATSFKQNAYSAKLLWHVCMYYSCLHASIIRHLLGKIYGRFIGIVFFKLGEHICCQIVNHFHWDALGLLHCLVKGLCITYNKYVAWSSLLRFAFTIQSGIFFLYIGILR